MLYPKDPAGLKNPEEKNGAFNIIIQIVGRPPPHAVTDGLPARRQSVTGSMASVSERFCRGLF